MTLFLGCIFVDGQPIVDLNPFSRQSCLYSLILLSSFLFLSAHFFDSHVMKRDAIIRMIAKSLTVVIVDTERCKLNYLLDKIKVIQVNIISTNQTPKSKLKFGC